MAFTGYLAEFSLPEVFQFLEKGQKTGLLTIRDLPAASTQAEVQSYYIWLQQGNVVAAANRTDGKGLISSIAQLWLSEKVINKSIQNCPPSTPLGLCLKSQGLLQAEQLTLLFRRQVVGLVSSLFQLPNGQFEFHPKSALPATEMTGFSLPATEATLLGLRTLRDWTVLTEKLPDISSALVRKVVGKPPLRLDSAESQVLDLATGSISLRAIAKRLGLAGETVQQIAFRLIGTNLVEEVFLLDTPSAAAAEDLVVTDSMSKANKSLEAAMLSANKPAVSSSFLQNLVGFLRTKG